jgi:hypothetical protein
MNAVRVRDVVRAVVADVAEAELPVVDGLASFDDDTVVRRLRGRGRGRRRERLGFGWDEIATVATPVVWLTVDQAARQLGTAAGKGASKGLGAVLRRVFRRRSPAVTVPPLTPQQCAAVRAHVLAVAAEHGVKGRRAEELADAVYVKLSLISGNGQNPAGGSPRT